LSEGSVTIQISVNDDELEQALSRIEGSQAMLEGQVDDVAKKAKWVISKEGAEIKGLETAAHRLARMVPGVCEVDRVYRNIGRVQCGYVLMAGINFYLISRRIVQMINQYFGQRKRQEQEFEATVREIRNMQTHAGYMQWSAD
jgi:hypothetical protein